MNVTPTRVLPLVLAGAAGAAFGLVLPRGPQDGPAAVATVLGALVVGAVAGRLATRRRWLLVLVAWLVAEAVRFPYGTSFDDLPLAHLTSAAGAGSVLLTRGVDAVVFALPLAVGLWLGSRQPGRRRLATVVAGLVAAASLVTLVPAFTPAVGSGALAGEPAGALAVAEVATVRIGGCDHRIVVRGASADKPVVFFLAGGPGGSEIGTLRTTWGAIEREFTVVAWDQTGAGVNGRCWPREGLTLDRLLADARDALAWTNQRFGRKPIVVGNSWGTFLGVLLVRDNPGLVAAYVGTGQMVDITETDVAFYDDTLAWARANGRGELVAQLEAQGPPPYRSFYPAEAAFGHEGDWNPWDRDPAVAAATNPMGNVWDKPEFDPMAKVRYLANLVDALSTGFYPKVQGIDLRTEATRLDVPVYLAAGRHEAHGRAMLVRPWLDALQAPHKEWVDFERSGHRPFCEETEAFRALLDRIVATGVAG